MPIKTAGPTIVTSKAKEAVDFHTTHLGATAEDYGFGADCWYWTLTYGEGHELSFMKPQDAEPEFGGGMFFYLELDDAAQVDAQRAALTAAGVEASAVKTEDFMYQFWATDPAGLRLMIYSAAA